jgi:hypothetical protein
MKKTAMIVLVIVALIGQAQAQETFKQRDQVYDYMQAHQVCASVREALPSFFYGYSEMNSRPLVLDPKSGAPPWLEYRSSVIIRTALEPVFEPTDLRVSPDSR